MTWKIRRLERSDDRSAFRSGQIELDRFFTLYAGQNQFRHHVGTSYVALTPDGEIAGFATVVASEINRESKGGRPTTLPTLRLARLAVSGAWQGRGVGVSLVGAVFDLAHAMAHDFGCVGVLVDAKPNAEGYYERLGFLAMPMLGGQLGDRPPSIPMFIPLDRIPKR